MFIRAYLRASTKEQDAKRAKSELILLDMLAAIARKDYEDRRNRQMQGIARAKAEGKYSGRRKDTEKRKIIASLLKSGYSYSDIQKTVKCSRQLIASLSSEMKSK